MKRTLTVIIIALLIFITWCELYKANAYTPSELEFDGKKWDNYYKTTVDRSFKVPNFYDAWDLSTGKWIKVAVIDSFENNYFHWVWIESLITSWHNDWDIAWYAPDTEVVRYNYCTWASCRYAELVPILDEIKARWDIKVINLSVTRRNKDYSAKLKELADAGIMVVTTLPNRDYQSASLHCEDNSIMCVWSYIIDDSLNLTWWDGKYKQTKYDNILGKWYYPEMDKWNGTTHRKSWTSFAAPQVASVIALMLEVNPDLTYTQVRSILKETGTKVSNWDIALNAYSAVAKAKGTTELILGGDQQESTNGDNQEVVLPVEPAPVIEPTPVVTPTPIVEPTPSVDMELANRIIALEKRLTDQNAEMIKIKARLDDNENRITWLEKIVNWLKAIFY